MKREPDFVFGRAYGVFFGASGKNEFHQNVAFQVIMSKDHDITVLDENDIEYVGKIVLIKPLVKSKIQCDGKLTHLYLSPRVDMALDLINFVGESTIHILTCADRLPFNAGSLRHEIIAALDDIDQVPTGRLDPRLLDVLEHLNQNLDNPSILDAAKRCGLSRARVRTLAREQMGMPLSTWVTWRKLVEANKALSDGTNLTDAALAGGFADQAHFSRTMKRMFGVTPSQATRIYA